MWASLAGVAVGGLLSFLTQLTTVRLTTRRDDRRQAVQLEEARRTERLELLREFITVSQQGIRVAEQRISAPDREAAATAEWQAADVAVIDRLWVVERMIQVLFPAPFYLVARAYADAVSDVMWSDPAKDEPWMWERLELLSPISLYRPAVRSARVGVVSCQWASCGIW